MEKNKNDITKMVYNPTKHLSKSYNLRYIKNIINGRDADGSRYCTPIVKVSNFLSSTFV